MEGINLTSPYEVYKLLPYLLLSALPGGLPVAYGDKARLGFWFSDVAVAVQVMVRGLFSNPNDGLEKPPGHRQGCSQKANAPGELEGCLGRDVEDAPLDDGQGLGVMAEAEERAGEEGDRNLGRDLLSLAVGCCVALGLGFSVIAFHRFLLVVSKSKQLQLLRARIHLLGQRLSSLFGLTYAKEGAARIPYAPLVASRPFVP